MIDITFKACPIPDDAEFMIECLYYKKGVHGFVFYWAYESGWLRSTRHSSDLHQCYLLNSDN